MTWALIIREVEAGGLYELRSSRPTFWRGREGKEKRKGKRKGGLRKRKRRKAGFTLLAPVYWQSAQLQDYFLLENASAPKQPCLSKLLLAPYSWPHWTIRLEQGRMFWFATWAHCCGICAMWEGGLAPWNLDAALAVAFGKRTGSLDLAGAVHMELGGPHNKAWGEAIGIAAI